MGFQVWSDKVSPHQALGVEATLTFILVFTILASQDPRRHLAGLVALPVGVAFLTNTLWAVSNHINKLSCFFFIFLLLGRRIFNYMIKNMTQNQNGANFVHMRYVRTVLRSSS